MNVLIVAAHPDDEVLGVGGTIARHAAAGDRVEIVIVAEGLTARGGSPDPEALKLLRNAALKASETLGARPPRFLGFPDNRLDSVALLDIVKPIEALAGELDPELIYVHNPGDLNIDHRIAFQAVATAFRPLPHSRVAGIFCFETPSSTEWGAPADFAPTHFVDIDATIETKLAALRFYTSELREFPHPRSLEAIRHLAAWRGASAGFAAAEAFVPWRTRIPGGIPIRP